MHKHTRRGTAGSMKLFLCTCENGSEMTCRILQRLNSLLYVTDTLSRELRPPEVRKPVVLTVTGILLRELFLGALATGPE